MNAVNFIATSFTYLSVVGLLVGLIYQPWVVLWWMETQNRLKVIKYYGSIFLLGLVIKFLTN